MIIETFGPAHLAILAAVPAGARVLASAARRRPGLLRPIRLVLAATIALDAAAWFGFTVSRGELRFPHGLPLDLCDVVLWIAVVALASPRGWALDAVYYLGLAGSGMALLTPDVGGDVPWYEAVQFFVAHGTLVGSVLLLVWAGALRPRPGSWWRVFVALLAYAAAVALFDLRFGTNYMYLREKPASGSLLDLLGPWPWYVLAGAGVALLLLWLLYLPFGGGSGGAAPSST